MICPDGPDGGVGLHDPADLLEPGGREPVVLLEREELVPVLLDPVDDCPVPADELFSLDKLEVVWRIGENQVHAMVREPFQDLERVAVNDRVEEPELDEPGLGTVKFRFGLIDQPDSP